MSSALALQEASSTQTRQEKIEGSRWKYKDYDGPKGPGRWTKPEFNKTLGSRNKSDVVKAKHYAMAKEALNGGLSAWEKNQHIVEENRERKRRRAVAGLPPDEKVHRPGETWEVIYGGQTFVGDIIHQDVVNGELKTRTYDGTILRPPTALPTKEETGKLKLKGRQRRLLEARLKAREKEARRRKKMAVAEDVRMITAAELRGRGGRGDPLHDEAMEVALGKRDKVSDVTDYQPVNSGTSNRKHRRGDDGSESSEGSDVSVRQGETSEMWEARLAKHRAKRAAARRRARRNRREDGKGGDDERKELLRSVLHGVEGYKNGRRKGLKRRRRRLREMKKIDRQMQKDNNLPIQGPKSQSEDRVVMSVTEKRKLRRKADRRAKREQMAIAAGLSKEEFEAKEKERLQVKEMKKKNNSLQPKKKKNENRVENVFGVKTLDLSLLDEKKKEKGDNESSNSSKESLSSSSSSEDDEKPVVETKHTILPRKNNPLPGAWKPTRIKVNEYKYSNRQKRKKGELRAPKYTLEVLSKPPPAAFYGPNAEASHNWSAAQQKILERGVRVVEGISKGRPPTPLTTPPHNSPAGQLLASRADLNYNNAQEEYSHDCNGTKRIGPTGGEVWDWGFKTHDDVIQDGHLVAYYASETGKQDRMEAKERAKHIKLDTRRSAVESFQLQKNNHTSSLPVVQCFRSSNPAKYLHMYNKRLQKSHICGIVHAICEEQGIIAVTTNGFVPLGIAPRYVLQRSSDVKSYRPGKDLPRRVTIPAELDHVHEEADYSVHGIDVKNGIVLLKLCDKRFGEGYEGGGVQGNNLTHSPIKRQQRSGFKEESVVKKDAKNQGPLHSPVRRGSRKKENQSLPPGQVTPLQRHWDNIGITRDYLSDIGSSRRETSSEEESYTDSSSSEYSDSSSDDESEDSENSENSDDERTFFDKDGNAIPKRKEQTTTSSSSSLSSSSRKPWMDTVRDLWLSENNEILRSEEQGEFCADADMPTPLPLPPGSRLLGTRTAWMPNVSTTIDSVWSSPEEWKDLMKRLVTNRGEEFGTEAELGFLRMLGQDTLYKLLTLRRTRLFGVYSLKELEPLAKAARIIKTERGAHVCSQKSLPKFEEVCFIIVRGCVYAERNGTVLFTLRSGSHFGFHDGLMLTKGDKNRASARQRVLDRRRRKELIKLEAKRAKEMRRMEKAYNRGRGRACAERKSLIRKNCAMIKDIRTKKIPEMKKQIEQALYLAGGSQVAAERHRRETQYEIDRQKSIIAKCEQENKEAEVALAAAKPEQEREEKAVRDIQAEVQKMRDEMELLFSREKEALARDKRLGVRGLEVTAELGRRTCSYIAGAPPAEEKEEMKRLQEKIAARLLEEHPDSVLSQRASAAAGLNGANRFGLSPKSARKSAQANASTEGLQAVKEARARNALKQATKDGRFIECITFSRRDFEELIANHRIHPRIIEHTHRVREQFIDHEAWNLLRKSKECLPLLDSSKVSGKERRDILKRCIDSAVRAQKLIVKAMKPSEYACHYGYAAVNEDMDRKSTVEVEPEVRRRQMACFAYAAMGSAYRANQQKRPALEASRKAVATSIEAMTLSRGGDLLENGKIEAAVDEESGKPKYESGRGDPSGNGSHALELKMRMHLGDQYRAFQGYRGAYSQFQKCLEMSRESCDLEGEVQACEKLMDICAKLGSRFESAEFCKLLIGLYPRLNKQRKMRGEEELTGTDINARKGWRGQKWLNSMYSSDQREEMLAERAAVAEAKLKKLGETLKQGDDGGMKALDAAAGFWPPRGLCLQCRRPLPNLDSARFCSLCGADNQELGRMSEKEVITLFRGGKSLIEGGRKKEILSPEARKKLIEKKGGLADNHVGEERDPFKELPFALQALTGRGQMEGAIRQASKTKAQLIKMGHVPSHDRFQHRLRDVEAVTKSELERRDREEREMFHGMEPKRVGRSEAEIGFGRDKNWKTGKGRLKGNAVGLVVGGSGRQATIFTWNRNQCTDEMLAWVVEKKLGLRVPLEPVGPGQRLSREEQKRYTRGELVLRVLDYDSRYEFFEIMKKRWDVLQIHGRKKKKSESVFGGGAAARAFIKEKIEGGGAIARRLPKI